MTTKLCVQTAEAGRVPAHPRKRSPVIHFLSGLTAWASVTSLQAAETVVRVTDINPGGSGSYPSCLTVVDNQLFFRGNTELNDTELWRFDGTNATRVSDIVPGVNGSSPSYLAALNGRLYFDARTAAGATKMHRYDGTNVVALNLSPSGFWGGGAWKPVAWNSELWYWTLAPPAALASFNGATIARLNSPPWANSEPVLFNGLLYYAAQDAYGVELWRFNGSVQTRISDLNPDAGDGRPEALFVHDGALYFRATDGSSGNELWRYTGSGSPSREVPATNWGATPAVAARAAWPTSSPVPAAPIRPDSPPIAARSTSPPMTAFMAPSCGATTGPTSPSPPTSTPTPTSTHTATKRATPRPANSPC
ncbi:MAG: hypothetical protein FJ221_17915 [Lentisphaerae bacterium]|nr:hypothetical protein [Lentisphaerota bacterium]